MRSTACKMSIVVVRAACSVALLASIALLSSLFAPAAGASTGSGRGAYGTAYELGLEAYVYGLPLLETNRTFLTQTSVAISNGEGAGPVNHFNSVRNLTNPTSTAVVAPGSNGLSSIAWLDLSREPQVLHVPSVRGHSFVLGLLDPYTNDFRNLGTVNDTRPGYYVILGPGQHGTPLPPGTSRIDVGYTRIWIIGSTQLKGPNDLANVHRIQDGYTLTALAAFLGRARRRVPAFTGTSGGSTAHQYSLPTGLDFFDVLGEQLRRFPAPPAESALIHRLEQVGIGPGRQPSKDPRLGPETLRGLRAAAAAGPARIKSDAAQLFRSSGALHNGYFLGGFGSYGTNYALRAVIAQVGLGAFTSEQTIFALSLTDSASAPLSGSAGYVMRVPSPPPVEGGWSLTVYNLHGFLVANPIDRYELSSGSSPTPNADGSVSIYLQPSRPATAAQEANWLPTPAGEGFEVIWRLIAPKRPAIAGILDGRGWQPPALTAVAP